MSKDNTKEGEMRKAMILLAVALMLPFYANAASKDNAGIDRSSLSEIIRTYSCEDGFQVVNIGSLGTSLLKKIVRTTAEYDDDPDIRQALKIISNIKKVSVISYEDVDDKTRYQITTRLSKALGKTDLLMEVKDGDDTMRMYGVLSEDSETVKDFVLFVPEDCALICLFGSLSVDAIMELAGNNP